MVDTENFTVSIPPENIKQILHLCDVWRQKTHCTKRELQSLLVSLLYISKCVRTFSLFLNRLLDVLHSMEDRRQAELTTDALRDINWFLQFLPRFNDITFFDQRLINIEIELDASLQGFGARWGSQVYALTIPLGYMNFQIVHLEMLNILAAQRVWQIQWSNMKVEIACNNQAVVQVLTSGKTRALILAAIARNIQFQAALVNLSLKFTHLPGKVNVLADLLFRWQNMHNKFLPNCFPIIFGFQYLEIIFS